MNPKETERDWTKYETRGDFVAWATPPMVLPFNGAVRRYAVVKRSPFGGLAWRQLLHNGIEILDNPLESSGAFYDGADDHPEGAVAWATDAARRHSAKG